MQEVYYSTICILAILVHLVVNRNYFLKKDDRQEMKDYRNYLAVILIYLISDAAWGFHNLTNNIHLLYIDTLVFYTSMALSVVLCCRYIISFLHLRRRVASFLNVFGMLFAVFVIFLLVINQFHHIFFWYDANGDYHPYFMRSIVFYTQCVMFGGVILISIHKILHLKGIRRTRSIIISFFGVIMLASLIGQEIYPMQPVYSVGLMLGTLIINIFIHNEDQAAQLMQIRELNEKLKEKSEAMQQKKDELATALAIINGLSTDYHSIWWANKDSMKLHNVRVSKLANPGAMKMATRDSDTDSIMQYYIEHFVMEEDRERMHQEVNTKVVIERLSQTNFFTVNYRRIKESGGYDYSQMVFANADDIDGKPIFVFGFRDITDTVLQEKELHKEQELRKKLTEAKIAAESASMAKTRFLHNMSHEIRTPLNAMFGFAQLLGLPDGSWTDEEKAQYNAHIYNSYQMLDMLISDILDIADSEHGNYHINLSDVRVNTVCQNAVMSVEFRVPPNVKLYYTSDFDDDFTIYSDSRRIQQVLINFLTNACKNTLQGEIHLHCSKTEHEGYVTFSVTDTGRGIPKEKANDIFNRFTKLNQFVQGSGLGLNICQTIADKLNGNIYLDTLYTNGARFVFAVKK